MELRITTKDLAFLTKMMFVLINLRILETAGVALLMKDIGNLKDVAN